LLLLFLVPAREAISIKKVKFTGGLYFDYNGTLHMSSNPEETTYVGPPSREIDRAWDALIHGQYFQLFSFCIKTIIVLYYPEAERSV